MYERYSYEDDCTFEDPQSYKQNSQIIKVQNHQLNQWPYGACVSIQVFEIKQSNQHKKFQKSSGTLIDQNYILTCAHLFFDEFYIKLRDSSLNISEYLQNNTKVYMCPIEQEKDNSKKCQNSLNKQCYSIQRVWIYKKYVQCKAQEIESKKCRNQKYQYDIMIIKLKQPVIKFKQLQFVQNRSIVYEPKEIYKNKLIFIGYSEDATIEKQKKILQQQLKIRQSQKQLSTQFDQKIQLKQEFIQKKETHLIIKSNLVQFCEQNEITLNFRIQQNDKNLNKEENEVEQIDVLKKKIKMNEESHKQIKINPNNSFQSWTDSKHIWPRISYGDIQYNEYFEKTYPYCRLHLASTTEQMSGAGVYKIKQEQKTDKYELIGIHVQGGINLDPNLLILINQDIKLLLQWLQNSNKSQKDQNIYNKIYIQQIVGKLKNTQNLSFQSEKKVIQMEQNLSNKFQNINQKEMKFEQQSAIDKKNTNEKIFYRKIFSWILEKGKQWY